MIAIKFLRISMFPNFQEIELTTGSKFFLSCCTRALVFFVDQTWNRVYIVLIATSGVIFTPPMTPIKPQSGEPKQSGELKPRTSRTSELQREVEQKLKLSVKKGVDGDAITRKKSVFTPTAFVQAAEPLAQKAFTPSEFSDVVSRNKNKFESSDQNVQTQPVATSKGFSPSEFSDVVSRNKAKFNSIDENVVMKIGDAEKVQAKIFSPSEFGNTVSRNKNKFEASCSANVADENVHDDVAAAPTTKGAKREEFGSVVSEGRRIAMEREAAAKKAAKGPKKIIVFARKNPMSQGEGRYGKVVKLDLAPPPSPKSLADLP